MEAQEMTSAESHFGPEWQALTDLLKDFLVWVGSPRLGHEFRYYIFQKLARRASLCWTGKRWVGLGNFKIAALAPLLITAVLVDPHTVTQLRLPHLRRAWMTMASPEL